MSRLSALKMIKRRAPKVGLPAEICAHSFGGTGITEYLRNGGDVELTVKMMLDQMAECLAGWRAHREPGLRQLLAPLAPGASWPQPQDRNAGVGSREVRPVLQARQEAARARQSRGGRSA